MENTPETAAPVESSIESEFAQVESTPVEDYTSDGPSEAILLRLEEMDNTPSTPVEEEAAVEEVTEEAVTEEKVDVTKGKYSQAFTQLNKRESAVIEREKALKLSSASLEKAEQAAKSFDDSPVDFLKAQLVHFTGSDDEEVVEDALFSMYERLTLHFVGADAPEDMQEQSQYQKLQRDFDQYKQAQLEEKESLESAALDSQRDVKVTKAQSDIKSQLSEAKAEFPYLLNQQDQAPEELVFELVFQDYNRQLESGVKDPVAMTIGEAANQANKHFQDIAQKWASIIPNAPEAKPITTGLPDTNRPGKSRTLTNNNASIAPHSEALPYIEDDEENKQRLIARMFPS